MKLIAFTGAAGAGKDTAATALLEQHVSCMCSFALPIYEHVSERTGYTVPQILARKRDQRGKWRELLEEAGDYLRDNFGDQVLIRDLEHRLAGLCTINHAPKIVLINDLRTEAEAQWLRAQPRSLLIHINRPTGTSSSTHHTNQPLAVDPRDVVIANDGAVTELRQRVRLAVSFWLEAQEVA